MCVCICLYCIEDISERKRVGGLQHRESVVILLHNARRVIVYAIQAKSSQ